jgi:hypothetical protein
MKTRKSKIVPNRSMKKYSGCGGIASPFLILGNGWRWVVNFTRRQLWLLEGTRYLLRVAERSGRCAEGKNSLQFPGFEPLVVQTEFYLSY